MTPPAPRQRARTVVPDVERVFHQTQTNEPVVTDTTVRQESLSSGHDDTQNNLTSEHSSIPRNETIPCPSNDSPQSPPFPEGELERFSPRFHDSLSSGLTASDQPFSQELLQEDHETDSSSLDSSEESDIFITEEELGALRNSSLFRVSSNWSASAGTVIEDYWSGLFDDLRDELLQTEAEQSSENDNENNSLPDSTAGERERAAVSRSGTLPGWEYTSPFTDCKLLVDNVDKELVGKFIIEANTMLDNVMEDISSREVNNPSQAGSNSQRSGSLLRTGFTKLEAFETFLTDSLLEKIKANVNRVLVSRKKAITTVQELKGVIIMHVLAASYSTCVSTMTAPDNQEFFFQVGIDCKRYNEIWTALSCTKEKRQRVEYSITGWCNKPSRGNALITELEQELAAVNRVLLYVAGATIFALDDDHQRLSSRAVTTHTSLRHINNPNKALGPVNNAMCSSLNPVFLASHYSRPREQQTDVWERLVQLIQGVPTSGALSPMTDAVFAADRGYNSKETIRFVNERLGATGLGTHKRSLDYPFVFGDGPIAKKHKGMAVSEKGCRAIYSAIRKPSSNTGRAVEAVVYRESFSGRIASVYHNNVRRFSGHCFTLVPKNGFRGCFDEEW